MELLHLHPRAANANVLQAGLGDLLGKRFGEVDVALGDQRANAQRDRLVIHNPLEAVFKGQGVFDSQIDIDAHGLLLGDLMSVYADMREKFEIANEDMSQGSFGARVSGWLSGHSALIIQLLHRESARSGAARHRPRSFGRSPLSQ